ncbi:uncharacterized protein LOC116250783 [Nymphaea colorata]|uniref:Ribosomal RNA processing protein 1 homolog n=1 Tax=Nymphaea colorata TaxID=210225 RepID=A0A5K1BKD8_9MAGN|nr:uncharacterized protein LOC116250783 [Nymphaea colorata]
MDAVDPALTGAAIAKRLASSDRTTRGKAVRVLRSWLESQEDVSEEEMKRIWKGLFYCFWHADKQAFQIELADRLASIVAAPSLPLAARYFEWFIVTIRREWSGIDFLRLDKFYMLIRRFMRGFFALLKKNQWDAQVVGRMMGILEEKSLLSNDDYAANGVNYHIAEIFLQELEGFLPLQLEIVEVLLRPFLRVTEKSHDKVLVKKIKSDVFDCLLHSATTLLKAKQDGGGDDGVGANAEVAKYGAIAMKIGLSKWLLESASSERTLQNNRKTLFDLHEAFARLEKSAEGVEVHTEAPPAKKEHVCERDPGHENGGVDRLETNPEADSVGGNRESDASTLPNETGVVCETVQEKNTKKSTKKKAKKANKTKSSDKKWNAASKKSKISACSADSERVASNEMEDSLGLHSNCVRESNDGKLSSEQNDDRELACHTIQLDKTVISNLQKQFEKVAAEVGMSLDTPTELATPNSQAHATSKKRKRGKSVNGVVGQIPHLSEQGSLSSSPDSLVGALSKKRKRSKSVGEDVNGSPVSQGISTSATGKSGDKSAKKVRFAMKNNLIWKPHSPLPPQSLRLPPSATPRGSALKKGIPPGPIRVVKESPKSKKVKQRSSSLKKSRKVPKSVSPSVKRIWKL